jgi:hypothetical protein
MPTVEARLERLERRVDGMESRFNDVLEAIADRWSSLSSDTREALGRATKGELPKKRNADKKEE